MEEFLVISWWDDPKRFEVAPVATTHKDSETARQEAGKRRKVLGINSRIILARVIEEL